MIIEEFFTQGDLEKQRGQSVSMYCDRATTDTAKSQAGFIKNIALPLYEILNVYLSSAIIEENCLEQLKNNLLCWEFEMNHHRIKSQDFNDQIKSEKENLAKSAKKFKRSGTQRIDPEITSWNGP